MLHKIRFSPGPRNWRTRNLVLVKLCKLQIQPNSLIRLLPSYVLGKDLRIQKSFVLNVKESIYLLQSIDLQTDILRRSSQNCHTLSAGYGFLGPGKRVPDVNPCFIQVFCWSFEKPGIIPV